MMAERRCITEPRARSPFGKSAVRSDGGMFDMDVKKKECGRMN